MKTGKLTACVCCAGLVLLSGCAADNGQEALNTAAGSASADTNITATVQPAASSALQSASTPVKPTSAYTSREPFYTFNPETPTLTPEIPSLPVIEGAEFLRPSDEEIEELKEVYQKAYEELKRNKQELLQDAIVSFDNACVGYDFYDYVFRDYDWNQGMPAVEDVRAYMSANTNYKRIYNVPIYSMDFNLIACMRYTYYSSGRTDFSIRFAYDDGLDYWKEMFYVYVLPMHTQAYYVYIATQSSKYLGNIQDMMLISEGEMNYSYCILTTDKGQFIYDRFYNVEDSISVDSAARLGAIYMDKDRFHMHYLDRLDAPHFIEGGVV